MISSDRLSSQAAFEGLSRLKLPSENSDGEVRSDLYRRKLGRAFFLGVLAGFTAALLVLVLQLWRSDEVEEGRGALNALASSTEATAPASLRDAPVLRPPLVGTGFVVTEGGYISIGVRVPGRVERYFVDEGQYVEVGDPLVQLDNREYRARLQAAEARLAVAESSLRLAKARRTRGLKLSEAGIVSQDELDLLQREFAVSAAVVSQRLGELEESKVALDNTLLRSPVEARVLARLKKVGEVAVPGGFSGAGDLIRLANLKNLRVELEINEGDIGRISQGDRAEVILDAYRDTTYQAEVVRLNPQMDRNKGALKVQLRLFEADGRFIPDMSAQVRFLQHVDPEKTESRLPRDSELESS